MKNIALFLLCILCAGCAYRGNVNINFRGSQRTTFEQRNDTAVPFDLMRGAKTTLTPMP